MMYSIIPDEVIFSTQSEERYPKTAQVAGVPVLVSARSGAPRVERILSTNPADYLKEGILGREVL